MFERFTDRARRVVVLAQEEARMLGHNYVGPEHVLLGLIHEGHGVAARALTELGVGLDEVRQQVEELIGQGDEAPSGHIPFTPQAKRVLELSLREALQLGHNYIGTEHILLGILREGENMAARVLVQMGADLNRVRLEVIRLLAPRAEAEAMSLGESPPPPGEIRTARGATRYAARYDVLLTELRNSLASIADRLTTIERHLGLPERAEDVGAPPDDEAAERFAGPPDDRPGGEADEAPGAGPDEKPKDLPGDVSATGE
jgi:ATP-dependent Clp protease ATP-binding subunit ClpC